MNVRILDDTTRFYLIIDNPTAEEKRKAFKLIESLYGVEEKGKEKIPEAVPPVKVETPVIEEKDFEPTKKAGSVPVEKKKKESVPFVIKTKEEFQEWFFKYRDLTESGKKRLLKTLGKFMTGYLKDLDHDNLESVKTFLRDFSPMLKTTITGALEKSGYKDLDGFLNAESEPSIRALFNVCERTIKENLNI